MVEQIGVDGLYLLAQIEQPDVPPRLCDLPAVQLMQQVWQQQYIITDGRARPQAINNSTPDCGDNKHYEHHEHHEEAKELHQTDMSRLEPECLPKDSALTLNLQLPLCQ